jgi:hypothetical protein
MAKIRCITVLEFLLRKEFNAPVAPKPLWRHIGNASCCDRHDFVCGDFVTVKVRGTVLELIEFYILFHK